MCTVTQTPVIARALPAIRRHDVTTERGSVLGSVRACGLVTQSLLRLARNAVQFDLARLKHVPVKNIEKLTEINARKNI